MLAGATWVTASLACATYPLPSLDLFTKVPSGAKTLMEWAAAADLESNVWVASNN
jgi:hypothetical protein